MIKWYAVTMIGNRSLNGRQARIFAVTYPACTLVSLSGQIHKCVHTFTPCHVLTTMYIHPSYTGQMHKACIKRRDLVNPPLPGGRHSARARDLKSNSTLYVSKHEFYKK